MIINHNMMAINTHRQLTGTQSSQSKAAEKLSSGLRINRAGDDAAGLAISEKMRAQIRGLQQASRNAQDGISLVQTGEGALQEVQSMLQRMRELAVQSGNDTYDADSREHIQKEIEQLKNEIDRIAETTEFNEKKLLNGDLGSKASIGATNAANLAGVELGDDNLSAGSYTVNVVDVQNLELTDVIDAGTGLSTAITDADTNAKFGSYQLTVEEVPNATDRYNLSLKNVNTDEVVAELENVDGTGSPIDLAGFEVDPTAITGEGIISFDYEADLVVELQDAGSNVVASKAVTDYTDNKINIGGVEINYLADVTTGTSDITVINNSLTFQIGSNKGQTMEVAIQGMSTKDLGIEDIDLSTKVGAGEAHDLISDALDAISAQRGKLGAIQNRLEHTINNLNTAYENTQSSESRIRDVDMALEMMNFTKTNILQQSAQAMLAQANQLPQSVLSLLR